MFNKLMFIVCYQIFSTASHWYSYEYRWG